MSKDPIEGLFDLAAGDGGSAEPNPLVARVDPSDLLRAWSIERSQSIECENLLKLSRLVIRRLLQTNTVRSAHDLRNSRALIRQIDRRLRRSRSLST